jgi:hypothetical protein
MARRRTAKEPLRVRFPNYVRSFGLGLAAALGAGVMIWLFTPAGPVSAIGYTYILFGTGVLLAGSARGGGYTSLGFGRVTSMVTGRGRFGGDAGRGGSVPTRRARHPDVRAALEAEREDLGVEVSDEYAASGTAPRRDPMERLRRGLRPEENPDAFWQTLAGFAYLGVGVAVTLIFV